MKKDAYYFPHFCNARHDRKIKRIQKDLGLEGYGIFFMLLEVLREQTDLTYPLTDIDLLADEFGTSAAKVDVIVKNYGLFDVDEENNFFSPNLLLYLQPYFKMKEQRKTAGIKSAELRKGNLLQRPFNDRSTTVQQSKVKESKVKESKVEESSSENQPTTTAANFSPSFQNIIETYQNNIGLITQHISERIQQLVNDGITEPLVCKYIEIATERNKRNWAYVEKMALGNLAENVRTVDEYEARRTEFKNKFVAQQQAKSSHAKFDQREYTEDEFDKFFDNLGED
jgi:DnaD/phage-associated family protein